jgi:glycosyltransferase involved in cell wall biosynthesis
LVADSAANPAAGVQFSVPRPWPKITLVTPVRNSARYLEQAMVSVLSQGYPNLEYFVVDGASTDTSVEIIRKYEKHLAGWISEPDNGMYDALNKGFAASSGEIMGWISATDILHVGGLFVAGAVFSTFPQVEWVTGRPTSLSNEGMTIRVATLRRWSRVRFLAGANQSIQQESTFWRRSLWERAGGHADGSLREGGDFELWVRFFRHAKLYSVDALIGAFREHPDSLGHLHSKECRQLNEEVIERELQSGPWRTVKLFRAVSGPMLRTPVLRFFWKHLVMSPLLRWPGPDHAPVIRYRKNKWRMV